MLQKIAKQLASMDEASLMALWDTYHSRVKQFEPSRRWEEACLIFGLIQTVRWKNQLFNSKWSSQQNGEPDSSAQQTSALSSVQNKTRKDPEPERGKVIRFQPREGDDE